MLVGKVSLMTPFSAQAKKSENNTGLKLLPPTDLREMRSREE
jgi:hypothetical protein